jgi:molecular chaperone DnaK
LQKIGESPDVDELHPIVVSLIDLLSADERPSGDDSVLVG